MNTASEKLRVALQEIRLKLKDGEYPIADNSADLESGSHGMLSMPWVRAGAWPQRPTAQTECRGYHLQTHGCISV